MREGHREPRRPDLVLPCLGNKERSPGWRDSLEACGGDGTQEEMNSCWAEKRGGGCERVFHNISLPAECTVAHGGQKIKYVQIMTSVCCVGFSPSLKVYESQLC